MSKGQITLKDELNPDAWPDLEENAGDVVVERVISAKTGSAASEGVKTFSAGAA